MVRAVTNLLKSVAIMTICFVAMLGALDSGRASNTTLYVSLDGTCGGKTPCFTTIQSAISTATSGNTLKISQGVYTATSFNVVFVNKALTITGGYTNSNWSNSYPLTQTTIIDGENAPRRRGLYIDGSNVGGITIRGVTVERGCASADDGSDIYIVTGTVSILDSSILDVASYCTNNGGGIYVNNGNVTLDGNLIQNNVAQRGGGIYIRNGNVSIINNRIISNTGIGGFGGGIFAPEYEGNIVLIGNLISSNSSGRGGGASIRNSPSSVTLVGNTFMDNVGYEGGAMEIAITPSAVASFQNNVYVGNEASFGSGIYVMSGNIYAQNDTIVDNPAVWEGIYVSGGAFVGKHLTIANNGKYAITTSSSQYGPGSVILTNTIIASHTVAGLAGSNILAGFSLFFGNGIPCESAASCEHSVFGDPRFINPALSDYHIVSGSAAIDSGIDAGVLVDFDGDPRPMLGSFDIGADELPPLPVPNFVDSSPNWVGTVTTFSNTTVVTGSVSYEWAFGDGMTSTIVYPNHAYSDSGEYTVSLAATNNAGTNIFSTTVAIYSAQFTSTSPDWLGQATAFTNTSVSSGTTDYQWNMGDVNVISGDSPVHVYSLPGTYTVTLTGTNSSGHGVFVDAITVFSPPIVDFTAAPTNGIRPLHVAFTNGTMTTPSDDLTVTYLWQLGDGSVVTTTSPQYVYSSAGTYSVSLFAANVAGNSVLTRTAYISVAPIPVQADFEVAPAMGIAPLTVQFTNTSTGDFVSLGWNFGDGGTSSESNPSHLYSTPGLFTVTLTASGPGGVDTLTQTNIITTHAPVQADFEVAPAMGIAPLTVQFTNTSTGDFVSLGWNFGDGGTSSESNPSHLYSTPGLFTVTLTASGPGGVDTYSQSQTVLDDQRHRIFLPIITAQG
jgi:PKD repeat protein